MSAGAIPAVGRPRSNGWWGMALFAAAEATLVVAIVGSYAYLRVNTEVWPPRGTPEPSLLAPIGLTVVLAASILPFSLAARRGAHGDRAGALALLVVATVVQAAYFGVQVHLFVDNLAQFTPQTSAYASIYYVLLGASHFHVALGLLFDVWLLARLATRLTPYRQRALEAAALYWIVVVGITVAVTLTELSPRL